jgi:DNA-binding Lrp family transcriptional regulator
MMGVLAIQQRGGQGKAERIEGERAQLLQRQLGHREVYRPNDHHKQQRGVCAHSGSFHDARKIRLCASSREENMVAAVVLIRAERDHIKRAAQEVAGIEGVAEVYSVSGEWDLVAIIRVAEWEKIATVVTEGLAQIEGLQRTQTLVAFRVYSAQDMESAFDMFE